MIIYLHFFHCFWVLYPTSLCGLPLDSNLETYQWALPPTAFLLGPLQWEPGVSTVPHLVGSLWCSCPDCQPAVYPQAGCSSGEATPHPHSAMTAAGGSALGGPAPDCLHLWNVATVSISLEGLNQGSGANTHVRVLGQLTVLHKHWLLCVEGIWTSPSVPALLVSSDKWSPRAGHDAKKHEKMQPTCLDLLLRVVPWPPGFPARISSTWGPPCRGFWEAVL